MKLFHKESKQKKETRSLPMGKKSRSAFAVYAEMCIRDRVWAFCH